MKKEVVIAGLFKDVSKLIERAKQHVSKDQEDIEYLELDNSGIHVAQYLTQLPPKKILEAKLKKAIAIGREKYERLQTPEKDDENGE